MSDSAESCGPASQGKALCRLEDIPDGRARGFAIDREGEPVEIFVLRLGTALFGYRNFCPHIGAPLDGLPDDFMSEDGRHLRCANHGALFRPEDGLCVEGPCEGDSLRKIAIEVVDGEVILKAI